MQSQTAWSLRLVPPDLCLLSLWAPGVIGTLVPCLQPWDGVAVELEHEDLSGSKWHIGLGCLEALKMTKQEAISSFDGLPPERSERTTHGHLKYLRWTCGNSLSNYINVINISGNFISITSTFDIHLPSPKNTTLNRRWWRARLLGNSGRSQLEYSECQNGSMCSLSSKMGGLWVDVTRSHQPWNEIVVFMMVLSVHLSPFVWIVMEHPLLHNIIGEIFGTSLRKSHLYHF